MKMAPSRNVAIAIIVCILACYSPSHSSAQRPKSPATGAGLNPVPETKLDDVSVVAGTDETKLEMFHLSAVNLNRTKGTLAIGCISMAVVDGRLRRNEVKYISINVKDKFGGKLIGEYNIKKPKDGVIFIWELPDEVRSCREAFITVSN